MIWPLTGWNVRTRSPASQSARGPGDSVVWVKRTVVLARSLAPLVKTRGFGMTPTGAARVSGKLHHYQGPGGFLRSGFTELAGEPDQLRILSVSTPSTFRFLSPI